MHCRSQSSYRGKGGQGFHESEHTLVHCFSCHGFPPFMVAWYDAGLVSRSLSKVEQIFES
jgi:hypothetical protein